MSEEKKSQTRSWVIGSIIIATVFGFAAGFVSDLFSRYYLSNMAFFQDLYLQNSEQVRDRNVIIRDPKKVVIEQDVRVDQLKSELRTSTVGFFHPRPAARTAVGELFVPNDLIGEGMIITSDGWIVTATSVPVTTSSVVVTSTKRIYEIEEIRVDTTSGYQFVKITAENLPVLKFADTERIALTKTAITYSLFDDEVAVSDVQSVDAIPITSRFDFVESSEGESGNIQLTDDVPDLFEGAPVVGLGGVVVGIYRENGIVIPITRMTSIINMVLKNGDIIRPYVGIYTIDITRAHGISEEHLQGRTTGALIVPNRQGIAIAADSPLAGILKEGDIITKVEGQELDGLHKLSDIIREFSSGDEITITYMREGDTTDVMITLGEL